MGKFVNYVLQWDTEVLLVRFKALSEQFSQDGHSGVRHLDNSVGILVPTIMTFALVSGPDRKLVQDYHKLRFYTPN